VGARWRAACCGALVAVAVVLAPGGAAPRVGAQTGSVRISIYGDSVLLGAKEELLADLSGQQVTVDAVEDRSLLGSIDLFQRAGPTLGDVVVLDLGYNDAPDAAVFRSRIDGAMAALSGVKRVIWLNQHDWGPGRAGMNAELVAAEARYPNLEVVDWNSEVAAHPDYVYADAIHLTPAGQTAMAALVREQFDQGGAARTTTTTSTTTARTTTSPAPASSTAVSGNAAAPTASDDDSGISDRTWIVLAAVAVLVVALAVSVGRRAARRAGRGARRAR